MSRSFTITFPGLMPILVTDCLVSKAWNPESTEPSPDLHHFRVQWDTGSTISSISQAVVDACGLSPVCYGDMRHAQGVTPNVPRFLVNITPPNNVNIIEVKVMLTDVEENTRDVLIGMDIINQGDFAITNQNDKTMLSFRMPSRESIDFTT